MSLVLIPRFSIAFIISIGIVIITGPTLMWFLESDVGLITESVFGQLIILKIINCSNNGWFGRIFPIQGTKNCRKKFLNQEKINVHKKLREIT